MKRIVLLLALCLLLSGCDSWMDGSHLTVTPHQEQIPNVQTAAVSAANYDELRAVMEKIVESGAENGVINVSEYAPEQLEIGVRLAAGYVQNQFPVGVYAIENLQYEIGSGGGQPAVSVSISYIHGRSEIRKIREVDDILEAQEAIEDALEECAEGVVLLIDDYEESDLVQMVDDFADQNPDVVMEVPQVAVGVYPDSGISRVVELKFTYQSSRDALRQMQSQVERVFTSAVLYTSSDAAESRKYTQLYTFLMERFDYKLETSITPSYSLLCHGVGDSKAFATAYAAMCRMAELNCQVVSGTRDGEPWYWNLILEDGVYYHVDLLRSSEASSLQRLTDEEMAGYVWDYSAYPAA